MATEPEEIDNKNTVGNADLNTAQLKPLLKTNKTDGEIKTIPKNDKVDGVEESSKPNATNVETKMNNLNNAEMSSNIDSVSSGNYMIQIDETDPKSNVSSEQAKALFWKTLTFWQNSTMEIPNDISKNHLNITSSSNVSNDEISQKSPSIGVVENSPQVTSTSLIKENISPSPTISPKMKPTSNSTVISTTEVQIGTIISNTITNDKNFEPNSIDHAMNPLDGTQHSPDNTIQELDNPNFIWDITRRLSQLPTYLQPHTITESHNKTFSPNQCSEVIDNNGYEENSDNSNMKPNNSVENVSWFTPWNWQFKNNGNNLDDSISEPNTGIVEDELLKVQRKEVTSRIKLLSYGIPKSTTWAILRTNDSEYGNVFISGSGYKNSVLLKSLPISIFEESENQLKPISENKKNNNELNFIESIVLPEISWNYRDITLTTKIRIALSKVSTVFESQRHLYYAPKNRKRSSQKIMKKAVILSFHSFLPQKITKYLIGEPTGSAEKMNEMATSELKKWAEINNVDISITTISLEGHGKLFERVNECLSILEKWTDTINDCDYFLSVSNSISVLLSIHTISKLITLGYLENAEKLGCIGLSGIFTGPTPENESKISTRGSVGLDNDIISEMFDLEDTESLQSKELIRNMRIMIKKNFKFTFVGSLNDCFTLLSSSLCLHLSHPNIYRAIYIDGNCKQPDFIVNLFNLILTVKNLNYRDHGLLIELSKFFTGVTSDGGHSKVTTNKYGYQIGINNMLNTSDLFYQQSLEDQSNNRNNLITNDYHIPWCLRGFLEELERLRKHFDVKQILEQLYEEFKSWEPDTQKMKDLKYCMEAFGNFKQEDLGL